MYTIYYRDLQSSHDDSWHQVNVTALTRSLHLSSLKCNTEYDFAVTAWNELGESAASRGWQIKTFRDTNSTGRTIGIVVPAVCGALILIVVGVVCFRERRKRKKRRGLQEKEETPPQRVTFVEELGQGAFGKVYKGILRDSPKVDVFFKPREQKVEIKEGKVVAIKVLLERAGEEGRNQLLQEIEFMKQIGSHRNVLSMLGYWVKSEPIMLILEYVPHGDLLQWLRNKRQQIKCKNSINEAVFEAVTEFADCNMSDTATPSKMSEEKAVNKKDDKAGEVENTQEADNQDSTGASHRAIPVDVEPFCGENRYERLPSNGSDNSCLEGIDVVFSETSRDASGELWSVDRIGDAIRMKKRDSQKIDKEEKVAEKVIPVFDSEERNIVIPEACAPSEHAEIITKTKEFSEQGDTKRLDVILLRNG
ncbi:hypothetical protein ACROYT_G002121 [Oculina patagonica]